MVNNSSDKQQMIRFLSELSKETQEPLKNKSSIYSINRPNKMSTASKAIIMDFLTNTVWNPIKTYMILLSTKVI